MPVIRILIVDNHPISRTGLKVVLQSVADFEVVAEASSGQQAIALCDQLALDVVLMDINMPQINGIEATSIITRKHPALVIIAFSGYNHAEMQDEAIRAGAAGYISKETDYSEMIEIVRKILSGRRNLQTKPMTKTISLTPMELRILTLLATGSERQTIADDLGISINTVKMHMRNLYQKLHVDNASAAVRIAIEHRLIS